MYDPKTKKLTHINTCFGTHHLMFAEDANDTLWTSGGGQVVGWLNTKMFEETDDEEKSQGWTALVLDTNGNGKRDAYVEPNQPVDPTKDKRFGGAFYAVAPAPDGSVWGSVLGIPGRDRPARFPDRTRRRRRSPKSTSRRSNNPHAKVQGFSPRGMDVDRNGVVWAALASGHLGELRSPQVQGSAERAERRPGSTAPKGWTLLSRAAAAAEGRHRSGQRGGELLHWVDQFDTLGLGANTPIATGNASEALLALKDGKWVVLRVPYPMGIYTKWMDGRIDDPKAAGRARACGPRSARARRSTWKAARERRAR